MLVEIFTDIDNSFNLIFVNNGEQVIKTLDAMSERDLPCLIVLDFNMPGLNGAEILGELKKNERYNRIPKVIWSTSDSDTYRILCLKSGATEYMTKASNLKDLETSIRRMLSFCST